MSPFSPGHWTEAIGKLHPVLRRAGSSANLHRAGLDPERAPVCWEILPFVLEYLVWEGERERVFVSPRQLSEWGVTAEQAREIGWGNLDTEGVRYDGEVWSLEKPEAAARLCLPGWWEGVGPLLAAVPTPDRLLLSSDARALRRRLLEVKPGQRLDPLAMPFPGLAPESAAPGNGAPDRVTLSPLLHQPDRATDPRETLAFASRVYADSQALILEDPPAEAEDCMLAGFRVDPVRGRSFVRIAVGTPTLLPTVDEVERNGKRVPFQAVEKRLVEGVWPRWWRVG